MEKLTEGRKVIDILDKMSFFQGQRAGRELWNDKPRNVQEKDLDNFNRDIHTIRDYILALENELKFYKDLEEQGLLLHLPCNVGDVIYFPIYEYHNSAIIERIEVEEDGVHFYWVQYEYGVDCTEVWDEGSVSINDFGKTVFLIREEAEKKLKELQGV